jgi:hypothetical protein
MILPAMSAKVTAPSERSTLTFSFAVVSVAAVAVLLRDHLGVPDVLCDATGAR